MPAAEEITYLKGLQPNWDERGHSRTPTLEALLEAEALLKELDRAGHSFSGFPVEDGGVDLQYTTPAGVVCAEIAPNGLLRDLSFCRAGGVVHASAGTPVIAQINTWLKP